MKIFLILRFLIFLKNAVYILRFSLINGNLEEKTSRAAYFFFLLAFSQCIILQIVEFYPTLFSCFG